MQPVTKQTEPVKPQTAGEMVKLARDFLLKKGIEEARLESELLVAHALGLARLQLFMQHDRPLADGEIARARELLVRRGKREPTAYLTGKREFYGRPFLVGPGALIPRPETELVVDRAREIARGRAGSGDPLVRAADFGTGSGCLAITLALEIEGLDVYAVDASEAALGWARRNVEALCAIASGAGTAGSRATETRATDTRASDAPTSDARTSNERTSDARTSDARSIDPSAVAASPLAARAADPSAPGARVTARSAPRVELALGDGYALIADRARANGRGFDLLVANPPYVMRDESADLAPEVRDHEPASALFAPEGDPDHHLIRLLDGVATMIAPGGTLLVELGHRQGPRAKPLAAARGLEARIQRDYGGIERLLEVRSPG